MPEARLIDELGNISIIKPKNGTDFSLEELYELIECELVEVGRTNDNNLLIFDEEGKLKNKTINIIAISVYKHASHDCIVGKVVLCPKSMFK